MKYIQSLSDVSLTDIQLVGGKAASLGEMIRSGIPVPDGFVITTNAYSNMNRTLRTEILSAFNKLAAKRVAVRSSAIAEDSVHTSWAGQLESFLNMTRTELFEAVEKCWQSIHSNHASTYAKYNSIPKSQLTVAVIVQKMVDSQISGVMFTLNPVTDNQNEIMIEAAYGLGELLVQGEITPDNYIIDKTTSKITSTTKGSQKLMLIYQNKKIQKLPLPSHVRDKQLLTDKQVKTLAKLGQQIESYYQIPQDIEWAIANDKIYIIQSRPITTPKQVLKI